MGAPSLVSVPIREHVALAPFTSLGIGGEARYFATVSRESDIPELVDWCRGRHLPWFILGGGSNLLVADAGFPGLVMHCALAGIAAHELENQLRPGSVEVDVAAGESWDGFVAWAVEHRLAGVECLSGIPGTAGAAPVQNIGAYGQEADETIVEVRAWDLAAHQPVTLPPAACGFGYRSSIFNGDARGRYFITAVRFRLQPDAPATLRYPELQLRFGAAGSAPLAEVRQAVREIRRGKAMLLDPADPDSRSAGSFFKNPILDPAEFESLAARVGTAPPSFPVVDAAHRKVPDRLKVPAAWLLERAGFAKGYTPSGSRAGLSRRHVLAIVNWGGATAREVLGLAEEVRGRVLEKFSITLAIEPELVGIESACATS